MMAHVDDYLAGVLRRGEKLGCICCCRCVVDGWSSLHIWLRGVHIIFLFMVMVCVYFLAIGRRKRWKVKINLAKMLYKRGGMEKGKGKGEQCYKYVLLVEWRVDIGWKGKW